MFQRIRLERVIDNGLSVYTGATADEIRHWMHLVGIPPGRRLEVADGVQVMVRTACRLLNERILDRYRADMRRGR